MINVELLIDRFGGMTALSKALGHKHPTTVQGWKSSGKIPPWRIIEIKAVAAELGIDVTEFFAEPAE